MCLLSQTDRIFILIEYFEFLLRKSMSLMGLSLFKATRLANLIFEKICSAQNM